MMLMGGGWIGMDGEVEGEEATAGFWPWLTGALTEELLPRRDAANFDTL